MYRTVRRRQNRLESDSDATTRWGNEALKRDAQHTAGTTVTVWSPMRRSRPLTNLAHSIHPLLHAAGETHFPRIYSLNFYRASICEGGLGSRNSVRPSVRPSVCYTRALHDKTKWRTADIFIPHEREITLLLWHQEWLVGDAPFPLKSALKVTHPLRETPTGNAFGRSLLRRSAEKKYTSSLHSLLFRPLPLELSPLNPARGLGSAVISPSIVCAPAEIELGAFWP